MAAALSPFEWRILATTAAMFGPKLPAGSESILLIMLADKTDAIDAKEKAPEIISGASNWLSLGGSALPYSASANSQVSAASVGLASLALARKSTCSAMISQP